MFPYLLTTIVPSLTATTKKDRRSFYLYYIISRSPDWINFIYNNNIILQGSLIINSKLLFLNC